MQRKRSDRISKERWDEVYELERSPQTPHTDIKEVANYFATHGVQRVLDLGSGSGRHTIYLAELGFEVSGIDISDVGIRTTQLLLDEKSLQVNLVIGSIYEKLPFEDGFFDAVISVRTLNHGTIQEIRAAIQEIERVLRSNGLVYVTVRKRVSKEKRLPFKEIAPRTYIPLAGNEKGVVHYLFTKELLRKEFGNFRLHKLAIAYGPKEWECYYTLFGQLKT